jgi:hypothetical protein
MKPEAQITSIAEACGWVKEVGVTGIQRWRNNNGELCEYLPNYLNDLNAMHKAEKVLWEMDWSFRSIFNDHLANIIKRRKVNRNEWDAETLLDATAAQRAEAFLRTIGKWTTNPNAKL